MTDGSSEQNPYGQQPPERPYGEQPPPSPYGQQPFGQPAPSYGQGTPPPPYGQPGYPQYQPSAAGYPGYASPVQHQDGGAQAAMVVGIVALAVGLLGCGFGFLASPVAWVLGARAKRRIDASLGQLGGRGNAQAGFVLGIVGTVLLVLAILALVAIIVLATSGGLSQDDSSVSTTNA